MKRLNISEVLHSVWNILRNCFCFLYMFLIFVSLKSTVFVTLNFNKLHFFLDLEQVNWSKPYKISVVSARLYTSQKDIRKNNKKLYAYSSHINIQRKKHSFLLCKIHSKNCNLQLRLKLNVLIIMFHFLFLLKWIKTETETKT